MAASATTGMQLHEDRVITGTLLVSMALHIVALSALPGWNFQSNRITELITVELQPQQPKPLPPPEPPKPEPEKPKVPPKKTLPQPPVRPNLPLPQPVPEMTPPPERAAEPPPPQVITAESKQSESPPSFAVPAPPPPEPAPKPKGPTDQEIDAAKGSYAGALSREFAKHKQYPRSAQMRGQQGVAKIELHIDAHGNIVSSSVVESSGFEILDKQALEMVRKASPLPLPPETLRGREFTISVPVAFRLE